MSQMCFRALADPTRRDILNRLQAKPMTIGEVAEGFAMTRAAVKKHLSILEQGGLITMTPRGREVITKLEPAGFGPIRDWVATFDAYWDIHLNRLKSEIEGKQP
jgi:DNA-binding transcriptional ArsR family regulator